MKMIRWGMLVAALSLAACGPQTPVASPSTSAPPVATAPLPSKAHAINATLQAGAAVADAINLAPPAALVTVPIGDAQIIRVWFRFDQALDVIDALVATRVVVPGTPAALALARGVTTATAALDAASQAQRAGTATSYREALTRAQAAITDIQSALKGGS